LDFYQVIGVPKNADDKEIKKAYREKAQKLHPDRNPDKPQAEEQFKNLQEAYATLGTPEKRKDYDNEQRYQATQSRTQAQASSDFSFGFDPGAHYGPAGPQINLDDIFRTLRSQPAHSQSFSFPPPARNVALKVSFEQAFTGTEKILVGRRDARCTHCQGLGCQACNYNGLVSVSFRYKVKVPAGISTGAKLRLPNRGDENEVGERGDLYAIIEVGSHPKWKRKGADLEIEVPITFADAVLGAEADVDVPLKDSKRLHVRAGTSTGTKQRLRGQGFPKLGGGRGDLFLRFVVDVPRGLSEDEKSKLQQLQGPLQKALESRGKKN
jgi:molecular chaperone DnaJ